MRRETFINRERKILFWRHGDNPDKTILAMVNRYYQIFTSIAIVLYIILALFIAVNILIKSTGREKEKYKAMMIDWVKGVMLLFFMPYMIKCAIMANEGLVGLVYTNVIQNSGGSGPLSKAQNASPSFKKDN